MMRTIKGLGIVVAVILAVSAGASVWLWLTEFSALKPIIVSQLERVIGRDVSARTLRISPGLSPTIVAEQVAVANPPWASRPDMIEARRIEVRLSLPALLDGEVRIERLAVVGPDILLERKGEQANWRFGNAPPAGGAQDRTPAASGSQQDPAVALAKVDIRNAFVAYRNATEERSEPIAITVEKFGWEARTATERLSISGAGSFRDRDWSLSGTVGSIADFLSRGDAYPIHLKGRFGALDVTAAGQLDESAHKTDNSLAVTARGDSLSEFGALIDVDLPPLGPFEAEARITEENSGYSVRDLALRAGDMTITGDVTVGLDGKVPSIDLSLDSQLVDLAPFVSPNEPRDSDMSPGELLANLAIPERLLSGYRAHFDARVSELRIDTRRLSDVRLVGTAGDGTLMIESASFGLAGGTVDGQAAFHGARQPIADVSAHFKSIQLPALLEAVASADDPDARSAPGMAGSLALSVRTGGAQPALTGSLNLDRLDLTPIFGDEKPDSEERPEHLFSRAPIRLDFLNGYAADLSVRASELTVMDLHARNARIDATLNSGRLTIEPIEIELAAGAAKGRAILDATANQPAVSFSASSEELEMDEVLKSFGAGGKLTGGASIEIDLQGEGGSVDEIMAGLDGSASLVLRDGRLLDTRLNLLVADLSILQILPPFWGGRDFIDVNCLVGGLQFQDGVGASTILVDTPEMALIGNGNVNLDEETLDLTLRPRPKQDSLSTIAIPVRIHGSLRSPQVDALDVKRNAAVGILGGLALPLNFLSKFVGNRGQGAQACTAAIENVQGEFGKAPPAKAPAEAPADQ